MSLYENNAYIQTVKNVCEDTRKEYVYIFICAHMCICMYIYVQRHILYNCNLSDLKQSKILANLLYNRI